MEAFAIAFGALVIGVVLGGSLARLASPRVAMIVALALIVLAAVLLVPGRLGQGWDALGYGILALLVVAPMGVSAGLVRLLAWWGLRRR
tara:strand:- start:493 stop:759 length:267 start_codon:yes stop_codon:yes gene_type:complete